MKKLLTIIASATATIFAFGAGAEFTESGTSFENYSTNVLLTTADDFGGGGARFWYSAANPDEAPFVITNAVPALPSGVARPELFAPSNNTASLMIETTDDKRLFRTAQSNTQDPAAFTQVGIPDEGIYLDTLVKFTAADSAFSSDLTDGDKIAISYVEHEADTDGDESYTNFVIRAGYVAGGTITQTNYFAAVPAGFDKDAWHRLTVRAIAELGTSGSSAGVGFVVYLDQVPLAYELDVVPGDAAYIAKFNTVITDNFYKDDLHAIYPSIVDAATIVGTSISAVSFSGNGSIDDVVFTTTKPSFMTDTARVRIEWDANVTTLALNGTAITGEDLAALSYELEPTNGVVDVVVTFASGYVAGEFTADKGGVWDASVSSFTGLVPGAVCSIKSMIPLYNVNGTNYDDLDAALEAAATGTAQAPATFTLLADCNQALNFTEGYIVLDLAGCDIQGNGSDFSIGNSGATLIITNSGAEASILIPADNGAGGEGTGPLFAAAGFTTIQAGTFEGIILTLADDDTTFVQDFVGITGGKFLFPGYDADDPTSFYLYPCVAQGLDLTQDGDYVQVGESGGSSGEDWKDPSEITKDATAGEVYGITGDLEDADAVELTEWATGVGDVDFADKGDINVDCFLLNIANDSTAQQIQDEKDEFVVNISFDSEGNPVITGPGTKDYNGKLKVYGSDDLTTPKADWHEKTDGDTFFYGKLVP